MTDRVGKSKWILACVFVIGLGIAQSASAETGILLLAHGGSAEWNGRVTDLVAQVNATRPAEVAFGMATRANIQNAIDKLVARGVTEIVAVHPSVRLLLEHGHHVDRVLTGTAP